MNINKLDLLKKGWSVKEIEDASKIIEKAENNKLLRAKFFDKTIYWALLFLVIVGNLICSTFLIPFAFAIKGIFVIVLSSFLGFTFGFFFSILISDIIKKDKQFLKGLLITLIISGVVNFSLISKIAMDFSIITKIPLKYDPYLISGIYLFSFLTPHAVLMIIEYIKK